MLNEPSFEPDVMSYGIVMYVSMCCMVLWCVAVSFLPRLPAPSPVPPRVFGVLVGWLLASTGGDGTGDGMVVFVTRGVVYGARCFGSGCAVGVLRSALLYSCVSDRDGVEATKASM